MIRRLDVKIIVALLFTSLIPLGVSVYLVSKAVDVAMGMGLNDRLVAHLEAGVLNRKQHIETIKESQHIRMQQISDSAAISKAANAEDGQEMIAALEAILDLDPRVVMIRLIPTDGPTVEAQPVKGPRLEKYRPVTRTEDVSLGPYTRLEVTFAVSTDITDGYAAAGEDAATYKALASAPPNYLSRRILVVYLGLLGLIVVGSFTTGVFWTRRQVSRIKQLGEATKQVAAGDLSVRVDPRSQDEVGQLVESFNSMVGELDGSRARIEYLQKISAWQEMARRLAHEIKNPLTPIHLAAQQLREKCETNSPSFARLVETSTEIIEEEVATLRRLTSDFSSFAKLPRISPAPVDLEEFLGECEGSLAHLEDLEDVKIIWEKPAARIVVNIDRMMMKRVMDNLTRNAVQSLSNARTEDPRVTVSVKVDALRKVVEIRVQDNGPGIDPEHQSSIFEPYFTTKNEGTGLGLAISKKVVLEHDGHIHLEETTQGASFVISLKHTS